MGEFRCALFTFQGPLYYSTSACIKPTTPPPCQHCQEDSNECYDAKEAMRDSLFWKVQPSLPLPFLKCTETPPRNQPTSTIPTPAPGISEPRWFIIMYESPEETAVSVQHVTRVLKLCLHHDRDAPISVAAELSSIILPLCGILKKKWDFDFTASLPSQQLLGFFQHKP